MDAARNRRRPGSGPDRRPGGWLGAALAALAGTLVLAGCTVGDSGPDPAPAADELAAALTAGDLTQAPVTADPEEVATEYSEITAGLGEPRPAVEVDAVRTSEDGRRAVAQLSWSWPLGEDDAWRYRSVATLALTGTEWAAVWKPNLVEPSLKPGDRLAVDTLEPKRGLILGAGGRALVAPRPVVRFGIDRTLVPPRAAGRSARRLAVLLGVGAGEYARRVVAAGERAFVEAIVFRSEEVPSPVAAGYRRIRGAVAIEATLPLAPTREFAAPILGSVGEVTAEMIEEDPETYRLGDVAGLSGLQARYDAQLRGSPGVAVVAVAEDGTARRLHRVPARHGQDLELSMDMDLQLAAERLLAGVRPASALVAIRPSTGEIVAAANGPGNAGLNLATYGQYAPGSTFKAVSSLALLRAGLGPDTPVPCPPSIVVDGRVFSNYSDYPASGLGRIPLRTALANSCNTAFISQRARLPRGALAEAAAALGFGVDHDVGFPAYFGQVRPAASATEGAANLIGQGRVLASPMAMATVLASVQAGEAVVPWLVTGVRSDPPPVTPLTATEARALRAMLRGVVRAGSGRLLADVPGPPVLAKTGTAEFGDTEPLRTHAWMVAAQGDLAVAVFVEVGESGSGTAGPLLEAFLRAAR